MIKIDVKVKVIMIKIDIKVKTTYLGSREYPVSKRKGLPRPWVHITLDTGKMSRSELKAHQQIQTINNTRLQSPD
jgi:hypothetical protein